MSNVDKIKIDTILKVKNIGEESPKINLSCSMSPSGKLLSKDEMNKLIIENKIGEIKDNK